MRTHKEYANELEDLRDQVRETGRAQGWDPSCERAREYNAATMPGQLINSLWGALNQAARSMRQLVDANEKLERRNSQLASSNGALMVDRTRGIDEAHQRMRGALIWAADVAKERGIAEDQWPEEARFRLGQEQDAWYRLEQERDRLERLRTGVVVALIGACQEHSDGFTADQVKRLAATLKRANDKALGR